ncbi:MAG TPA: hypothetical protein VH591_13410 [Ktedonobacterales bacterium]|jgi:hypothetical protein
MTPRQRIAIRIAFALIAISGGLLALALTHTNTEASCSTCTGTYFGVNETRMNQAIGGTIWPQTLSNACAVADVVGLINYDYLKAGKSLKFPNSAYQSSVEQYNKTSGSSQWGYAKPTNQVGGITNIAPDFGNDPRSAANDVQHYHIGSSGVHDYVYRWQFAHRIQPSYSQQAQEATTLLVRGLENTQEPAIVFINGGLHSVLVTGAWSSNNPNIHFPANIQGLVYRDSEGNSSTSRQEIPISTWIGGHYANQFGVYSLWSLYYGDRTKIGDMRNTLDPEPTVGPYKPSARFPHHWYLGFTWVQHDSNTTYNADWAFNPYTNRVMLTP